MEVAGLIISVLPLAITTLECYKKTQKWASRLMKRNMLVRSLIRKLKGYQFVLNTSIDCLLLSSGAFQEFSFERNKLLEKPEVIKKLRDYLGEATADAVSGAMLEFNEALKMILKRIEGFLPVGSKVREPFLNRDQTSMFQATKPTASAFEANLREQSQQAMRLSKEHWVQSIC